MKEDELFQRYSFNISTEAFDEYLDEYHPVREPFLPFFQKTNEFDNVYCSIYDLSSEWMLVNEIINSDKKTLRVVVENVEFNGTIVIIHFHFIKMLYI